MREKNGSCYRYPSMQFCLILHEKNRKNTVKTDQKYSIHPIDYISGKEYSRAHNYY